VNEKTIDQIEEVLMCEISDEAVEAAGRVEIAGVWTFVCTSIQCGHLFALNQLRPTFPSSSSQDGRRATRTPRSRAL
jgi:hypothetical protein